MDLFDLSLPKDPNDPESELDLTLGLTRIKCPALVMGVSVAFSTLKFPSFPSFSSHFFLRLDRSSFPCLATKGNSQHLKKGRKQESQVLWARRRLRAWHFFDWYRQYWICDQESPGTSWSDYFLKFWIFSLVYWVLALWWYDVLAIQHWKRKKREKRKKKKRNDKTKNELCSFPLLFLFLFLFLLNENWILWSIVPPVIMILSVAFCSFFAGCFFSFPIIQVKMRKRAERSKKKQKNEPISLIGNSLPS